MGNNKGYIYYWWVASVNPRTGFTVTPSSPERLKNCCTSTRWKINPGAQFNIATQCLTRHILAAQTNNIMIRGSAPPSGRTRNCVFWCVFFPSGKKGRFWSESNWILTTAGQVSCALYIYYVTFIYLSLYAFCCCSALVVFKMCIAYVSALYCWLEPKKPVFYNKTD